MTAFPYSVEATAPLQVARDFMRQHQIRDLPVTDGDRLFGVMTDRDIKLMLGPDFYPDAGDLSVRDVCVTDPYVVDLDERLDTVLLRMAARHIGSVLVTCKGKLAGLFTVTDACRHFGEYLREQFAPGGGDEAA